MKRREYLIGLAQEELNETIHALHKVQRFGPEEVWPYDEYGRTNIERARAEIWDFIIVNDMLSLEEGLNLIHGIPMKYSNEKKAKIQKYLEYSRKLGIISE